ncbi:50S ribosomal protein L30 [uncultured archaeon]|nr:50S ribosomal protein L30 [uncultured archaeon]
MKLAIIRVRGRRNMDPKIKKTLELLNLRRPNHCVLMEDTPYTKGMLNLTKDYVTFGAVTEPAILHLLTKRGRKGSKRLSELSKEAEIKEMAKKLATDAKAKARDFVDPVFTLRPPSKGWRDIKRPFPGGDLGARPDVSALIKRMA